MSLDADLQSVKTEVAFNPAAVERLESLRLAIQPGADPAGWDTIDVFRAIDPAGTVGSLRQQPLTDRRLARLEWLRNVLVLVPVFITWVGLKAAGDGYQAALAADKSLAEQPLLLLWQHGFYGYGPWWADHLTLSTVALFDALVIAVMIGFTWSIHRELNVRQAGRERQARAIEDRLHQVAWQAAREVGSRTSQAARFNQHLDVLRAEHRRIERLAKEREKHAADLQPLVDKFKAAAGDFLSATTDLQTTLTTLNKTATTMDNRAAALVQQEAALTTTLTDFTKESQEHNKNHKTDGESLKEAVKTLTDAIKLITRSSTESVSNEAKLAATVALVQAELASLRQELIDDRKAHASAATTIQNSVRALEQTSQDMAATARRVEDLAPAMQQLAQASAALEKQAQTLTQSVPTKDTLVEAGREVLQEWRQSLPVSPNGPPRKRPGIFSWWSPE